MENTITYMVYDTVRGDVKVVILDNTIGGGEV